MAEPLAARAPGAPTGTGGPPARSKQCDGSWATPPAGWWPGERSSVQPLFSGTPGTNRRTARSAHAVAVRGVRLVEEPGGTDGPGPGADGGSLAHVIELQLAGQAEVADLLALAQQLQTPA